MRIAYLTTEDVNHDLAQRTADGCGATLEVVAIAEPVSKGGYDSVLVGLPARRASPADYRGLPSRPGALPHGSTRQSGQMLGTAGRGATGHQRKGHQSIS
jgi:hypothetical protein